MKFNLLSALAGIFSPGFRRRHLAAVAPKPAAPRAVVNTGRLSPCPRYEWWRDAQHEDSIAWHQHRAAEKRTRKASAPNASNYSRTNVPA